jgi:hypothetical protein
VTSVANTDKVFLATPLTVDFDPSFGASGTDYRVQAISTRIDISNVGLLTFSDPTFCEDPNGSGDIIFGDIDARTGILGMTALFPGLETYNLQSSIGPISSALDFESSSSALSGTLKCVLRHRIGHHPVFNQA